MSVLLVEDDANKIHEIELFCRSIDVSLNVERSYNTGLRYILNNSERLELLLLDMNIPTFTISAGSTGGRRRMYGGKDILWQMSRRKILIPSVIITQFDWFDDGTKQFTLSELTQELRAIPNIMFLDTIFYSPASEEWKSLIRGILINRNKSGDGHVK